jgi:hypothetical protein
LNNFSSTQLSLAPLGAGDLIDRAIRLYRRHFSTLLRIAAPPVVVSTGGSVLWTVGWGGVVSSSTGTQMAVQLLLMLTGMLFLFSGLLLQIVVMGGAARNLVTHLLWNEPVTARRTYANVWSRIWGLLAAAMVMGVIGGFVGFVVLMILYFLVVMLVLVCVAVGMVAPVWFTVIVGVVGGVGVALAAFTLFFLVMARIAYVPQVIMVEGKGVMDAIGRSFTLARGNIRRIMALAIFATLASYSALMILIIPLGWIGYLNGINPFIPNGEQVPAWYSIGYSVIGQISSILIAPIWMLGLSLLYVDERVRHEGYDIELMAARNLGPMPQPQAPVQQVYTPALVTQPEASADGGWGQNSTLGLR